MPVAERARKTPRAVSARENVPKFKCLVSDWLKTQHVFLDWLSKCRVQQNHRQVISRRLFVMNLKGENMSQFFFNKPEVHASDIDRLDRKLFLLEKIRSYRGRQPVNGNNA